MAISRYELSAQEMMLLNSEMRGKEKSLGLTYVMLLGGHLGIHRFYLKRIPSGIVQLVLFLFTMIFYFLLAFMSIVESETGTMVFMIFMILFGLALFIWIVIDLFMIPKMVKELNDQTEAYILSQIEYLRQHPVPDRHAHDTTSASPHPSVIPPSISLDKNE